MKTITTYIKEAFKIKSTSNYAPEIKTQYDLEEEIKRRYKKDKTHLDLTDIDVSSNQITSFSKLFSGCPDVVVIDVTGWNTENITDMSGMFRNCSKLTTINGLEDFRTRNVENFSGMFHDCYSLKKIDIHNWVFFGYDAEVTSMFFNCYELEEIVGIEDFPEQEPFEDDIFSGCKKLKDIPDWYVGRV